jgi:hypothetical protein
MINEVKEEGNKYLNKFKENTNKQLSEIMRNSIEIKILKKIKLKFWKCKVQ